MSLFWNGDAVIKEMTQAECGAIDETTSLCVRRAKANLWEGHGVVTAALQGSIRMEPAKKIRLHVVGTWGSFTIEYAMAVEVGWGSFPGYNYLRQAADIEYPQLAGRIRAWREAS